MNRLMKYRMVIIIGLLFATVALGSNIRHLTRDAGVSSLLPEDHPDYLYWKEMEEVFGATDQIVVGVTTRETIYTPETLRLLYELTTFFVELDEIDEDDVTSLANIDDMRGLQDELLIEPLFDGGSLDALDAAGLARIRERVRTNPLFWGKLVSEDERSAVIIAGTTGEVSMNDQKVAALKSKVVEKIVELSAQYPQATLNLSGTPILKAYISEYMQKDVRRLFPLAILVVMLFLFFLLRSVYGMAMPVLITLFSVAWTFGLKSLLGSPMTIVETVIPIMLIAIGCADGVHLLSEFFGFLRNGLTPQAALTKTMRILTLPVVLTSVTTALGFLSLLTAPGVSIRNMGIYLAFGVMVAMVFSLWFLPALTSFYRAKPAQKFTAKASAPCPSKFQKTAHDVGTAIVRHNRAIVGLSCVLLFCAFWGMLHIEVESDEVRYFKRDNPFRRATEYIQGSLGGITSLDIILEGEEPGIMKQPRILRAMWDLQKFCERHELVSYSLSLADLIRRINYALHEDQADFERLPNDVEQVCYTDYESVDGQEIAVEKIGEVSGVEQVAQFLLLYEMGGGDATDEYVDSEYQRARISVRLNDMSSKRLTDLLDLVTPYIASHFPGDVKVRYSNHYIRFVMQRLITQSQIYSLLTVLGAILLLMSLIFRSAMIGVMMSMPVFIAVLLNFAVMWLTGVTLNIGTSIVASVGMGVGIDYAIHYFSRVRLLLQQGSAYDDAIARAVAETSRAILGNAFSVGFGFLALLFSEYLVIANIGWITALSMFTTALSSLVVLPALLAWKHPAVKGVNAAVTRRACLDYSTQKAV